MSAPIERAYELPGARVFLAPCSGTCGASKKDGGYKPHVVAVSREGIPRCTDCPAGKRGIHCRHCKLVDAELLSEARERGKARRAANPVDVFDRLCGPKAVAR